MPGQFIDDEEPKFIDDAEGPSAAQFDSSMDVGIGTTRQPVALSSADKLKAMLQKRAAILKGYTPLGPQGLPAMAYRAVTGEVPPSWVPEPTAEGAIKGLSNVVTGPMRLKAELGKKLGDATGIEFLKKKYGAEAEAALRAAKGAEAIYRENAQESKTGEMIGESAPFMAMGPTQGLAKLPSLLRPVGAAGESFAVSQLVSPQAQAETSPEYWQAQRETGQQAATIGGIAGVGAEVASPLMRLFKGGKPKINAAGLPDELRARIGEEEAPDVFQAELKKAYAADRAEASKPYEALRAQDVPSKPVPEVDLYGGQTSYKGKRMSSLMGPNDEMIVAKAPNGEDAGFMWITKEGDGFSVRKVEVDPKFQRKGIATYMNNEAEKAFGPYKGATDYTPQGKAFREAVSSKKQSIELPSYQKSLADVEKEITTSGGRVDSALLNDVKGYAQGYEGAENTGWGRALNISRQINDDISAAWKAGDRNRVRILEKIKTGVESDLSKFPEFAEAKSLWKERMAPWEGREEGGTFLKKAMDSPTPDAMMKEVSRSTKDKAEIYFNRLSDKGRDAVKSSLLEDVLREAEGDPLKISKAIKSGKRPAAFDVFFQGEDLEKLKGFEKLAKYSARTGTSVAVGGGAAGASLAGPYAPLFGAWIGKKYFATPASKAVYSVAKTDALQRLLLDAAKLDETSPELGKMLKQLPKLLGASAEPEDKLKKLLKGQQQ